MARRVDGLFERRDRAVHLLFVDRFQDFSDARAGYEAQGEEMAAEQDRLGRPMLDTQRAGALEKPVHRGAVELARLTPFAVGLGDARQQLEIDLVRQTPKGAVADLVAHFEPGPG